MCCAVAWGCSHDNMYDRQFELADSLMVARPDSALGILRDMSEPTDRVQRMRHALLLTDAMNKCDVPFDSDSVMQKVVAYYDKTGTANERMRANYLLGRVYHELGDGPQALEYYLKAQACADTTRRDCNYYLLECIHHQAFLQYMRQALVEQMTEEIEAMERCAWKAKDTANVVYCYHLRSKMDVYNGTSLRSDEHLQHARTTFEVARRLTPDRSGSYCADLITSCLEKEEYEEAKTWMDIYETSPMWDTEDGCTIKGNEVYYYSKGLYYLGIHKLDSAAYFFYKEMAEGDDFNNQILSAKGLLRLYEQLHKSDSVAKYAMRAYMLNDSIFQRNNADYLQQTQATYNYSLQQKKAQHERERRQLIQRIVVLGVLLTIIVALVTAMAVGRRVRSIKANQEQTMTDYQQALLAYAKLSEELKEMKADAQGAIAAKEKELRRQGDAIRRLTTDDDGEWDVEEMMLTDDIVLRLHQKYQKATLQETNALLKLTEARQPAFFQTVTDYKRQLSKQEIVLCVLIRLRFNPSECAILLGVSSQRITNLRTSINKKLFNVEGTKKIDYHIFRL